MTRPQQEIEKEAVASAAAALVPDGCRLGLGSGSTLELFAVALAVRVAEGLRVTCVPTSSRIAALAQKVGLTLADLGNAPLDLAIDGADEVDPQGQLIKGAGGAMVRERIVAAAAKSFVVIVDQTKLVARLGERMPLPVEIQQYGCERTRLSVAELMGGATFRLRAGQRFVSDNGGFLLDCPIAPRPSARELATALRAIPGVVDTGFFLGLTSAVLIARGTDIERLEFPR